MRKVTKFAVQLLKFSLIILFGRMKEFHMVRNVHERTFVCFH